MYQSPKLLRYGSFRDLTRAGLSGSSDQLFFLSVTSLPPIITIDTGGGDTGTITDVGGSR
jgi:hypothetical protein